MKAIHFASFMALLISASATFSQMYKWVDEEGKVHFGDSPPEDVSTEELDIKSGPSQSEIEIANQNLQKMLEARELKEAREESEPTESQQTREQSRRPILSCSNEYTWDGGAATNDKPIYVESQPLEVVLKRLAGKWKGKFTEVECLPNAKGVSEEHILANGPFSLHGKWNDKSSSLSLERSVSNGASSDDGTRYQYFVISDGSLYFAETSGIPLDDIEKQIGHKGISIKGQALVNGGLEFSVTSSITIYGRRGRGSSTFSTVRVDRQIKVDGKSLAYIEFIDRRGNQDTLKVWRARR